ncbi:hypothetical protein R0135_04685 [Congregibacter variabilis]|uniref:Uncharacterized protein n=1 Tax=Congregibacter variabilis TaxID=3081200 RepID=A0ABZ0I5K6_9GAMM|nr:hypothetical protein R0135_04685 [Congregibacter sp. IMCC43200]
MGDSVSAISTRPKRTLASIVAASAIALCLTFLAAGMSEAQEADITAAETDVERLRGLLLRHQGADTEKVTEESPIVDIPLDLESQESEFAAALNAPYSPQKVLLRPQELPLLLADVEARLADSKAVDRRSDSSLIGTTQIRQRGSLIGSSRYSLTHIGKHQFFGYTELAPGLNILGVADKQWEIELPTVEGTNRYLLLLVAPPRGDWELHALPASATMQLGDAAPQWLREPTGETSPTP